MKNGYKNMRCGLIGEHLGHSFSRIIHEKIADYSYEFCELAPDEVGEFVRGGSFDAFNVTIPYKKTVMPFLDRISDEAKRIGAVNTVVRRADGSLDGYNTDYFGFDGMLSALGTSVEGKKAIVLGSGGASATVCAVLHDRGVSSLTVIGRALEDNYDNIDRHYDAEIIVNTTPVGMYPKNGESPIDLSRFEKCQAVLDVIYNPSKTALLLEADRLGIPNINGLYMLVAQAVRAYEYFTGDSAESGLVDKIRSEIEFDTKNIILIGMPGCGKSTVGRYVARVLKRQFVDADTEFSKMHNITPANAIKELGEDRFREMENATLCEICKESGRIIATGGGAVTREYNYAPIKQNSTVVYLSREISRLATEGRPLSQGRDLSALYEERRPLYEHFADIRVDSTEIPDLTAYILIEKVKDGVKK